MKISDFGSALAIDDRTRSTDALPALTADFLQALKHTSETDDAELRPIMTRSAGGSNASGAYHRQFARNELGTALQNGALTGAVGTMRYRAPEVLGGGLNYSFASDVWAIGVSIREFIVGHPPWDGDTEQTLLEEMLLHYRQVSRHVLVLGLTFLPCPADHTSGFFSLAIHFYMSTDSCAYASFLECARNECWPRLL